ncbi:MAG: hypothetical protein ACLFV4_01425 [Candidatus Hydrogenedentota bacterium]
MLPEWIQRISDFFPGEVYLHWSRIQGSLWTLAGYVIIFYLLRLTNLCRAITGRALHRLPYVALAATIPFALVIPIAPTSMALFRIELAVTVPHFFIILYLLAANLRSTPQALAQLTQRNHQPP